jgi:hypothetical protein
MESPLARRIPAAVVGSHAAVSKRRKAAALAVAGVADLLQIVLFPFFFEGGLSPFDDALDAVVAVVLLATLGFRWRTLLALGLELMPGVALFPSWTAMVATIPAATLAPAEATLPDHPNP